MGYFKVGSGLGDVVAVVSNMQVSFNGGTAQPIATVPMEVEGLVIMRVVCRKPTGTQPLSYSFGFNTAANDVGTQSLSGLGGLMALASVVSTSAIGNPGDVLKVKPFLGANGTLTIDVLGYFI